MDSFEVENFRSLKHLKLEKLARVNLLVGKNNSGKTSVLEALCSLSGIGGSAWYDILLRGRDIVPNEASFRQLFYGLDSSAKISLSSSYRTYPDISDYRSTINVAANLLAAKQAGLDESEWEPNNFVQTATPNDGLSISVKTDAITSSVSYDILSNSSTVNRIRENSKGALAIIKSLRATELFRFPTSVISSRPRLRNIGTVIEKLKVAKKDDALVEVLRQVDDRIERIELGSNGQVYFNLGSKISTLLPANIMGEGMQRLLIIVSVMINRTGGLVFIDEIDNGLHYSVLRILWKGILKAARDYDVQVFATTHSAEALRHLTWVLDDEENASYRDDVAAYTLIRADDDTVRTYRHDYEQLDYALDHGLEIRN